MSQKTMPPRSLAHPDWPYTGTPWEWRGFARSPTREQLNSAQEKAYPMYVNRENVETNYQKLNFGPELK